MRDEKQLRLLIAFDLDDDQLGDRRVAHTILDAVDDPVAIVGAQGLGRDAAFGCGAMVARTDAGVGVRFMTGEGKVIAIVGKKLRQEAIALCRRHQPVEQDVAQRRSFGQHGGDVDVAHRQLLDDDTAGQVIRARTAILFGQRHGAQTHLRGLGENVRQQRMFERLQAFGLEGDRLDFLRDEIPDRIAELQLLCAEMKIVHVCQSVRW